MASQRWVSGMHWVSRWRAGRRWATWRAGRRPAVSIVQEESHLKQITEFSLRNPLVVGALTVAVIAFGLSSYLSMGVGIVPNVSFPLVLVTTTDAGADPATVETQITKPIEDAVAGLPNIDTITSTSSDGISSVQVQFTTAANNALAPVDVERVVNSVRNKLPADADPPSILKPDIAAFPVIYVAVSGPQTLDQINQVATDQIERAFEAVPGVQAVTVSGGQDREIHVKVDPRKLEGYGIGLNAVQLALQSEQLQIPAGQLTADGKNVNVRLNGLVSQPNQLQQIVVDNTPTGLVYLGDVATIEDGFKATQVINRVNGVAAVTVSVSKLDTANILAVSKGIRQAMNQLQPLLPQDMHLYVIADAATYTQQSFDTIQLTLIQAVLLTGLILLVFLHTWRSTLIVLVAIPTSLFTTFGLMSALGMDLNLFSMLAVTLSVGILVDDSIVVLENIFRHLGLGEPPVLAAINGRSEIGLAALTITMVDVAVYVPIALISGVAGDFIRPFAVVVAAATLTSLAVSFTLTPLLASRLLTPEDDSRVARGPLAAFGRWWDRGFSALGHGYRRLLRVVLTGHAVRLGPLRVGARWSVILLGFAAFAAGLALFASGMIGIDIFPSGDQSQIDITFTMPSATAIESTDAVVQTMEQKLSSVPEVRSVYSSIGNASGFTPGAGEDTAQLIVLLTPVTQRHRSSASIADELRKTLDPGIQDSRLDVSLPNAFGAFGVQQPIQVAVRGPDPATLNPLVDQVTAAIEAVPGAVDVNNPNQRTQPEFVVDVNRARAADLGITSQTAATALEAAVNGIVVSKYREPGHNDVDIRLMSSDAFRASPGNLAALPLQTSKGTIVRLGQIGTILPGNAPTQIDHVGRERSVLVGASASGSPVGTVSEAIQNRLSLIQLPPGYSITYQGQAAQGAGAFNDIFKALGTSLVLMYVLMTMLFGSVTLPLAVLTSLPLAVIGALGALALTGNAFTLFSLLGIAMLVGLVGKNAILLVDYTDTLRRRGMNRTDALVEAGPTRLRPIVMTTMSLFASLTPVALGTEVGSELLRAAALVLIGGLLTSTLLTLVFVPAMYTVFDDIQGLVGRIVARIARPRPMEPEELEILQPSPFAEESPSKTPLILPPRSWRRRSRA
jgi:hydrophobic/amphiphilic exporter-1 (mainly G- bacteria), HAE1 family